MWNWNQFHIIPQGFKVSDEHHRSSRWLIRRDLRSSSVWRCPSGLLLATDPRGYRKWRSLMSGDPIPTQGDSDVTPVKA